MKVVAVILSACMVLLNTGNLLEQMRVHASAESHHMECGAHQDASCCDRESDTRDQHHEQSKDHQKSCDHNHNCGPDCHCSCGFHFSALVYDYKEMDGIMVQSFHYGNYVNTYSFEYFGDFLQPPRKA